MAPPRLLSIHEAADMLGVPKASLRTVADEHGKTIVMGRAVRLHPDDLGELIRLCRVNPKAPASIDGNGATVHPSGKSGTPEPCRSRPAQTAANMLKRHSPCSSSASTAQVVQLAPKT